MMSYIWGGLVAKIIVGPLVRSQIWEVFKIRDKYEKYSRGLIINAWSLKDAIELHPFSPFITNYTIRGNDL